jgi:hypothetical protein
VTIKASHPKREVISIFLLGKWVTIICIDGNISLWQSITECCMDDYLNIEKIEEENSNQKKELYCNTDSFVPILGCSLISSRDELWVLYEANVIGVWRVSISGVILLRRIQIEATIQMSRRCLCAVYHKSKDAQSKGKWFVWVGGTGEMDVIDAATRTVTKILVCDSWEGKSSL